MSEDLLLPEVQIEKERWNKIIGHNFVVLGKRSVVFVEEVIDEFDMLRTSVT